MIDGTMRGKRIHERFVSGPQHTASPRGFETSKTLQLLADFPLVKKRTATLGAFHAQALGLISNLALSGE